MKREDIPPSAIDRCRSCRAEFIWTETAAGKDMPVDLAPGGYTTTGGDGKPHVVPADLNLNVVNGIVKSRVVKPSLAWGNPHLHLSHFVRCPQSKSWRRHRSYSPRKASNR